MEIHFVRGGPSYLPELAAYSEHLASTGHQAVMHETHESVPADAHVVWWVCGRVPQHAAGRLARAFHVHEYASASVPPLAWWKDRVKRWTHPRPHHRVFQSEWVRRRLGFGNTTAFSLRDMGVPRAFLHARAPANPEFDLVYAGATSRLAQFEPSLRELDAAGLTLLVIGSVDPGLIGVLAELRNVHCIGSVPQSEVAPQMLRARAGLNLMPGRLPFTQQTSTKVLEYLAVGIPVVSNDYAWIRRASQEYPGRIRIVGALDSSGWRAALDELPPREDDRSHLAHLAWEARLAHLPVWRAIEQWGAGA
jgi:hypothetical protein